MARILSSNTFWGRRSGVIKSFKSDPGILCKAFVQQQFGTGRSGSKAPFRTALKNVPRKWFGKSYN